MKRLLACLCSLALAVTCLAAGFAACAAPATTRALTTAYGDFATTPYGHDQLVNLAVLTRDYTVDHIPRATLEEAIVDAARASAFDESLGKSSQWKRVAAATRLSDETQPADQVAAALGAWPAFGLDDEVYSHLDDCYALISGALPWLWLAAAIAAASLVILVRAGHVRTAGSALIAGPAALLAFMAVCGIAAAIDFEGFFALFHGVLFPQGNWTFPADSLLICMLPEGFWMGMGALWLAVTLAACIVSMVIGRLLMKRGATAPVRERLSSKQEGTK